MKSLRPIFIVYKSFKLTVSDIHHSLPLMYWMPKMYYSPCRARFIVASSVSSSKPLSELMSTVFCKVFEQTRKFHTKCQFYKNYNRFWVIQNSKSLLLKLEQLDTKKAAKKISTFDFSTLYTKLPHKDLIGVLQDLVEFVFINKCRSLKDPHAFLQVQLFETINNSVSNECIEELL